MKCKNCDISMTVHQQAQAYQCHYCGYRRTLTTACGQCGSTQIKHLGLGTEKLVGAVQTLFPKARVGRMDRDTTARKGSIVKLLKDLRHHRLDILVGTQMVAKGHDFPKITLVGIICADLSLNFPDFRAGERTFQLLAQVAGRAGRGQRVGRVILQTYAPENMSILSAKHQDFRAFYKTEIEYRKSLRYPPFSRLVLVRISGKDATKTESWSSAIGALCTQLKGTQPSYQASIDIMGPIESSLPKIAKYYRWHILLKGSNSKTLRHFIRTLMDRYPRYFNHRDITVNVDVDPMFMM
jgi:primosomal protein N' (replication factor Y)